MTDSHPLGRFVLEWPTGKQIAIPGMRNGEEQLVPEMRMATYQVTGKWNDVYVESSVTGQGEWMDRHCFELFLRENQRLLAGVESKPVSKNWKPMAKGSIDG